jgi:hypothetical protein
MKPLSQETDAGSLKWGYAFAGACAVGFAALIQVAFDGLDEEALANLPAIVTVPYGLAGKLGITMPLALLGVGLILRDVMVNGRGSTMSTAATTTSRLSRIGGAHPPKPDVARKSADDLEVGEPLVEDLPPPAPSKKPARKIAALAGGFGGRREGVPETTGGPVGDSVPLPQRPGSGQVVLSSAKYLNKNPGGSFRRGTTQHTNDE